MRTTAVLLRGGRWREGTRATVVQMLCTYLLLTIAVASSHGQTAQPQAEPNTALQVSMVGGYSGVTGVPTGQQVLLQARGTQIRADAEREEGSFTSVSWSASAGSFPYGSEGQEVIWQAPDYVCRTTIRAETGGIAGPATAEAIVPSTTVATMTVDTLYLMAIHMVMVNPVLTAYPYIGDAFHTRVLLCVCAPDEGGVYCGRWWPTLSWAFENGRVQGALAEPAGKPGTNTPPPLNDYVWGPIYPWPTYWAQPTILLADRFRAWKRQ